MVATSPCSRGPPAQTSQDAGILPSLGPLSPPRPGGGGGGGGDFSPPSNNCQKLSCPSEARYAAAKRGGQCQEWARTHKRWVLGARKERMYELHQVRVTTRDHTTPPRHPAPPRRAAQHKKRQASAATQGQGTKRPRDQTSKRQTSPMRHVETTVSMGRCVMER